MSAVAAVADAGVPGAIVRFTLADMPEWGEWLIGRLSDWYPGFNRGSWLGKLQVLLSSNDFLFVRNDRAALCLSAAPRVLDGAPIIEEVFAYSRDAVKDRFSDHWLVPIAAEAPLVALYRHARLWCRARNAAGLVVGQDSDIHPERLRKLLDAPPALWIDVPL